MMATVSLKSHTDEIASLLQIIRKMEGRIEKLEQRLANFERLGAA